MDLFWNLVIAGIAFVGAVLAGVLTAVLSNRATREYRWQDRDRELSELKGELAVSRSGPGGPPLEGNVLRLLGKLEADVTNMRDDVAEIKEQQSTNRDAAKRAHNELRELLQAQIDKLVRDLKNVNTTLEKLIGRHRPPTRRTPPGETR